MRNNNWKNKKVGIAILFAILLVSIVLTVGLTLLNITVRQLVLSSLARESQFAFYAADSARNCVRYYDSLDDPATRPFGYFELSGGSLVYVSPPASPATPTCGAQVLSFVGPSGSNPVTATLILKFTDGNTPAKETCATVFISKYTAPVGGLEKGKTKIESHGYNNYRGGGHMGADCYVPSDRTVERAATMIY